MLSSPLPEIKKVLHQKGKSTTRGVCRLMERGFKKGWPSQGEPWGLSHDTWTVFWDQHFTYYTAIESRHQEGGEVEKRALMEHSGLWRTCFEELDPVCRYDPFFPLQSRQTAGELISTLTFSSPCFWLHFCLCASQIPLRDFEYYDHRNITAAYGEAKGPITPASAPSGEKPGGKTVCWPPHWAVSGTRKIQKRVTSFCVLSILGKTML